ncbi:MAG TPA: alpha/beta hydrolase family protein [Candidatus Limiplasma sp.]|nr:alpha/beta hydrolase family protein [Candidatus Limiplasma sp.]HPS81757.1 alpha/beta hydrolase family protein [Candidatus Limiplasma sp.]
MIWIDFHFRSQVLGIETAAYVLLPDPSAMQQQHNRPIPTLYLLHGLSDDHTAWMRNTRIEQYARRSFVAVVMPAANRSFYADMAYGAKYWTFVSEELPRVMETYFPLAKKREGRFAAGLSMGGYGAMKLGLCLPEQYSAVAALSAPLRMHDAYHRKHEGDEWFHEMDAIFGDEEKLREGNGNLFRLAKAIQPENAPRMYAACGTADFLYEDNQAFIESFGTKLGIEYHTKEGASHSWDFWDEQIRQVLAWLPLERLDNIW